MEVVPTILFERTVLTSCDRFTFMRVKVSEGVWIDAYNVHTDAG